MEKKYRERNKKNARKIEKSQRKIRDKERERGKGIERKFLKT